MAAQLADIADIEALSRALGVEAERILAYANAADQASYYEALKIPKRGRNRRGQHRTVYKAKDHWLLQFHSMAKIIVVRHAPVQEHIQGFVKRRSIRTNAKRHLGARYVMHADIENFFDAITTAQVRTGFVRVGANEVVADALARGCTIDGFLRQGTRCSPALANLVCGGLDADFLRLAEGAGARYTRYADDLVFSGEQVPDPAAIRRIIESHGFSLRDGRCYLQRRGKSQFVTGLHIADVNGPRLPRRMKRRLRLVLHYIAKKGCKAHLAFPARRPLVKSEGSLRGLLSFVNSVEPRFARKLYDQLSAGVRKDNREHPSYDDYMDLEDER